MNLTDIGKSALDAAYTATAALSRAHLTVSTAESCTGGLISKLITDVSGASAVFCGGIVSYSNEMKISVLGVDANVIAAHGAVSEETALLMADGARRLSGSDIAVSATGIAGPAGGTREKPVGTVYIGIVSDKCRYAEHLSLPPDSGRNAIRYAVAEKSLEMIIKATELYK